MQGGVAELPSKPKRYVPLRDPRRLNRDADMRSPDGQRFAAIFDTLVLEFGDAGPDRIRDIAVLRFAAEKALDVGNFEDVVRLHNTIERKESRLRAMLRVKRLERGSQSPEGPSVPACGSIRRQGPCAMKATRTASAAFGPVIAYASIFAVLGLLCGRLMRSGTGPRSGGAAMRVRRLPPPRRLSLPKPAETRQRSDDNWRLRLARSSAARERVPAEALRRLGTGS
jgi:hypothetical protein